MENGASLCCPVTCGEPGIGLFWCVGIRGKREIPRFRTSRWSEGEAAVGEPGLLDWSVAVASRRSPLSFDD